MYNIYWMNQHDKDWTEDKVYLTKGLAIQELESQGYVLNGGWYKREQIGWEGNTRALVSKVRLVGTTDKQSVSKMTWKDKLGISASIKDANVVRYLKELGFEDGVLPDSIFEENRTKEPEQLTSKNCLCISGQESFSDTTFTIFVNDEYICRKREVGTDETETYGPEEKTVVEKKFRGIQVEALTMDTIDKYLNKLI